MERGPQVPDGNSNSSEPGFHKPEAAFAETPKPLDFGTLRGLQSERKVVDILEDMDIVSKAYRFEFGSPEDQAGKDIAVYLEDDEDPFFIQVKSSRHELRIYKRKRGVPTDPDGVVSWQRRNRIIFLRGTKEDGLIRQSFLDQLENIRKAA